MLYKVCYTVQSRYMWLTPEVVRKHYVYWRVKRTQGWFPENNNACLHICIHNYETTDFFFSTSIVIFCTWKHMASFCCCSIVFMILNLTEPIAVGQIGSSLFQSTLHRKQNVPFSALWMFLYSKHSRLSSCKSGFPSACMLISCVLWPLVQSAVWVCTTDCSQLLMRGW